MTSRRRFGWRPVKKPIATSYIRSGTISLAASTAANYSLLLSSDSPLKTAITDLSSGVAQCENNTRIIKKGSFIQLNMLAATAPLVVGIWIYMNSKGMVVAPTDSDDFSEDPTTLANAQLREKTIYYRQVSLSTTEYRSIRIPLGSKRNNFLPDPTSILVMVLHNKTATTAMSFHAYGRIHTVEG